MWICLNNSFVSIIEDIHFPEFVFVRSRQKHHLENFVGPGFEIKETFSRDYCFRARVTKIELAHILFRLPEKIDYGNFKNSVKEKPLSIFYSEVWTSGFRNLDPRGYDF